MAEFERAVEGWQQIADIFNVTKRMMLNRRQELMDAGVIFYIIKGQPKRRVVCAFPSVLKAWISKKSAMGEFF